MEGTALFAMKNEECRIEGVAVAAPFFRGSPDMGII